MEAVIRALGVEHIQTVRPTNLKKVAEATRAALDHDGVSVIICREPCPLHMRRLSKAKKPVFGIDGERCVNCHTLCGHVRLSGLPASGRQGVHRSRPVHRLRRMCPSLPEQCDPSPKISKEPS